MPLIELFQNVKFMVNFNDHNPPHFHVWHIGTGYKASFRIDDGTLLAGNKPDIKTKRIVQQWLSMNREKLNNAWEMYCG